MVASLNWPRELKRPCIFLSREIIRSWRDSRKKPNRNILFRHYVYRTHAINDDQTMMLVCQISLLTLAKTMQKKGIYERKIHDGRRSHHNQIPPIESPRSEDGGENRRTDLRAVQFTEHRSLLRSLLENTARLRCTAENTRSGGERIGSQSNLHQAIQGPHCEALLAWRQSRRAQKLREPQLSRIFSINETTFRHPDPIVTDPFFPSSLSDLESTIYKYCDSPKTV